MNPYQFNLSLRIKHPERDLSDLYAKLSMVSMLKPKRIWKVGDVRIAQDGRTLEGQYIESYCYFSIFNEPQDSNAESLSSTLDRVTKALLPYKADLDNHTNSGGTLEFFVGLYVNANSGDEFSPILIKTVGDLGIYISLDIYPS